MMKAIATPPSHPTKYVEDTDNRTTSVEERLRREAWEKRQDLAKTDMSLIRVIEDIYDVLTADQKAALPQAARDKIEHRKGLRK